MLKDVEVAVADCKVRTFRQAQGDPMDVDLRLRWRRQPRASDAGSELAIPAESPSTPSFSNYRTVARICTLGACLDVHVEPLHRTRLLARRGPPRDAAVGVIGGARCTEIPAQHRHTPTQ